MSSTLQLPEQQSHEALHDIVGSLQTSPSGLQLKGFLQMPKTPDVPNTQVTAGLGAPGMPAEPQQSLSFVHVSPVMRQPVAGAQTN